MDKSIGNKYLDDIKFKNKQTFRSVQKCCGLTAIFIVIFCEENCCFWQQVEKHQQPFKSASCGLMSISSSLAIVGNRCKAEQF